jgi:hypothetical protein
VRVCEVGVIAPLGGRLQLARLLAVLVLFLWVFLPLLLGANQPNNLALWDLDVADVCLRSDRTVVYELVVGLARLFVVLALVSCGRSCSQRGANAGLRTAGMQGRARKYQNT